MANKGKSESVNTTGEDPIVEPENSTVDDWLGQRVDRDEARADEPEVRSRHIGDSGFGESDIPDPMPEALRDEPDQTEYVDEMGGESPTG